MRKSESISIGGKNVRVEEISPRMVMDAFQAGGKNDGGAGQADNPALRDLLLKCTNLEVNDLLDLYGSELEELWECFTRVNSFFFTLAKKLGLDQAVARMADQFVSNIGEEFALLSGSDTQEPPITGAHTS